MLKSLHLARSLGLQLANRCTAAYSSLESEMLWCASLLRQPWRNWCGQETLPS